MRAGLLSQPPVLEALQQHYVCSWILPASAQELSKNGAAAQQAAAKILLANYQQLAEVVVLSPQGKLVDHRDVNDILDRFPSAVGNWEGDPEAIDHFLEFLDASAGKALQAQATPPAAPNQSRIR